MVDEPSRLPIVLPVMFPMSNTPDVVPTTIAMNGEEPAVVEARLAEHFRDTTGHPDYAKALALFTLVTALALIIIAAIGPEQRGKEF